MAGRSGDGGETAGPNGGNGRAVVFRGVSELVLDAKGRLAIPARHRDGLASGGQGHVVITADHGGCLLIYPITAWEPIQAQLMGLSSFDDTIRSLQRLIVGHADDVDLDAAGRILIPPALRRYAGLDKRVVLVGQGHKLELWDEAKWQAQIARTIAFPGPLPRGLEDSRAFEQRMQVPIDGGHVPVLLAESLAGLALRDDGVYVDATFGRGGHARAMLDVLDARGRVIAIDRDPAAEAAARGIVDARFTFRRGWFSELPDILAALGIHAVDGVLLDLGVSSPQLEDPARGFTFRVDGPLDMRMDPSRGETAAEFLAHVSVGELTRVLRDYGEERFARAAAGAIAKARDAGPIVSTRQLAAIVAQAIGTRTRGDWRQDPAARTFQALRIAVNRELHEVSAALPRITTLLKGGGRLAAISFHSLEDRIVKRFLAFASKPFGGNAQLARMPIAEAALPAVPLRIIGRAIKPSATEIARNPRARSAVLRIAERTAAALPADWPRGFESAWG